jgi:hypothetical protein
MRLQLLALTALFARCNAAVHAFTNDPSTNPFWWTFHGTPILEGAVFSGIVTEHPPSLPGLARLYEAYNANKGDYPYTEDANEYDFIISALPGSPGYGDGAFDNLYVFSDNEPNTVPLYRFWNGQNHFFSTDYNEGINAGYGSEGVAVYVYLSANNGAVPIYRRRMDWVYFSGR